jgi:GDPmannose 4,6-dehydratase
VRDLCEVTFSQLGLDYRNYVRSDPSLQRPGQPIQLLANPLKAQKQLGWKAKITFEELIKLMMSAVVERGK